jgi:pyrimidine operon attenuation protein/uracil phosphoribosyltransferase
MSLSLFVGGGGGGGCVVTFFTVDIFPYTLVSSSSVSSMSYENEVQRTFNAMTHNIQKYNAQCDVNPLNLKQIRKITDRFADNYINRKDDMASITEDLRSVLTTAYRDDLAFNKDDIDDTDDEDTKVYG